MGHDEKKPGIDREWVHKASRLSRLKLTEEEISELVPQLEQILDHVDQLRAVQTVGIEPFIHPLLELLPGAESASLREDKPRDPEEEGNRAAAILEGAPELTERAFEVPQAVAQRGSRNT
jgi:aspartyl-tRNA(Asn)/glutamyl-tRNA(Gln) amidotransferase subunit C